MSGEKMKAANAALDGEQLDVLDEIREDVTDGRAEQGQDDDNHDGDQHEDECVLYQALAFFTR
jgi:hypothetical protein